MLKPNERFKILNTTGTLTHCPFCTFVNDDSSEMIHHVREDHEVPCELYVVKSLEGDNKVLHLAEFL